MTRARTLLAALALVLGGASCHPNGITPVIDDDVVGKVIDRRFHDWGHGTSYYLWIERADPSLPTIWLVVRHDQWYRCRITPDYPSTWDRDHCE